MRKVQSSSSFRKSLFKAYKRYKLYLLSISVQIKLSRSDIGRIYEKKRQTDRREKERDKKKGNERGSETEGRIKQQTHSCVSFRGCRGRAENRSASKIFLSRIRAETSGRLDCASRVVALVGMIAVLLFQPLFFHYSIHSDISFNLYRVVRRVYESNVCRSDTKNERGKPQKKKTIANLHVSASEAETLNRTLASHGKFFRERKISLDADCSPFSA